MIIIKNENKSYKFMQQNCFWRRKKSLHVKLLAVLITINLIKKQSFYNKKKIEQLWYSDF